jgi:P-type Ca2+ transporter type 2C
LTRHNWIEGFLAGIAMAMAVLPEEFPVVLTIFLAMGAWRISKSNVLTRRMPVVETLGATTILCVDKTGTLTQNRMTVKKIVSQGEILDLKDQGLLPNGFHEVVEISILASQRDPFDPMEKAFKQLGDDYLAETEHIHKNWSLVQEYPLSKELLAMSRVWRSPSGQDLIIASKGAPEAIADLCHLSETQKQELSEKVSSMANEGLRILGIARAHFHGDLPVVQHDFKFQFVGLIGLSDPIRPDVAEAITECYQAGIRVVMITGDYPDTARAIARQIGIRPADEILTGPGLQGFSDLDLQQCVRDVNIFSRVLPEQKLRLVSALKAEEKSLP